MKRLVSEKLLVFKTIETSSNIIPERINFFLGGEPTSPFIITQPYGQSFGGPGKDSVGVATQIDGVLDWQGLVNYVSNITDIVADIDTAQSDHVRTEPASVFIDDLDCLEYLAPSLSAAKRLLSLLYRKQSASLSSSNAISNIVAYCHGRSENPLKLRSSLVADHDSTVNHGSSYNDVDLPTLSEFFRYRYCSIYSLSL